MAEVITQCDCGQLPALTPGTCLGCGQHVHRDGDGRLYVNGLGSDICQAGDGTGPHILEPLSEPCEGCGAEAGEECRPMCTGRAARLDAREDARGPLGVLASLADQWEAGDVDPDMVTAHVGAMVAEIRAMQSAAPQ